MKTYNEQREEHVQWLEKLDTIDDPGFTDDQLTDEEFEEVTGYARTSTLREIRRDWRVSRLLDKKDEVTPQLMLIVLLVLIIPNVILLCCTLSF